jgi:DNA-binding CsgD family transcriptional regulator
MRKVPSHKLARAVALIYDAALDQSQWPQALGALSDAAGAQGACSLVANKQSDSIEWVSFSGPCAGLAPEYIKHYSAVDPYTPLIAESPAGSRLWLSELVPHEALRKNEWYNDFVEKNSIKDIFGGKLLETQSRVIMFGFHAGGEKAVLPGRKQEIDVLLEALGKSVSLQTKLQNAGWMPSAAVQALDQLSAAVILVDRDRRVFELNRTAERIIETADGLVIRSGHLGAIRSIDQNKIAEAIASATAKQGIKTGSEGLLVARREGRPSYVLAVAPLSRDKVSHDRPLAIVLVINPEWRAPSLEGVIRIFGLSPAEARLAIALMQGRRTRDIARSFGVEITTVRTQLSSILKKVGVERQSDLIKALSDIGGLSLPVNRDHE